MSVDVSYQGRVCVVTLNREGARNAVDRETAEALARAFREFDASDEVDVAVFYGAHGHFCAGADLKAIAAGEPNRLEPEGDGPMGPSRMILSKPVIAAISGYAVAGGLELALWCDLRVAESSATLGVFCRRFGVPLIDGGTVRLPRLIGMSRAMDLILTGRGVGAEEALQMGLVNRVVPDGEVLEHAIQLAEDLCEFPQQCMRHDRLSAYEQWGMSMEDALFNEFQHGQAAMQEELWDGARAFARGAGRQGKKRE